jgi:hypothetical protein
MFAIDDDHGDLGKQCSMNIYYVSLLFLFWKLHPNLVRTHKHNNKNEDTQQTYRFWKKKTQNYRPAFLCCEEGTVHGKCANRVTKIPS